MEKEKTTESIEAQTGVGPLSATLDRIDKLLDEQEACIRRMCELLDKM